jgi:hypothetical protein
LDLVLSQQTWEPAPECPVIKIVFRLERVIAEHVTVSQEEINPDKSATNPGQQTWQFRVAACMVVGFPC